MNRSLRKEPNDGQNDLVEDIQEKRLTPITMGTALILVVTMRIVLKVSLINFT